jgi:parallel beta-helix repeat protein
MKNIFTLLFVFSLCSVKATNYYFSAVSGDDSRSSAQARSASTPWKTIGKLNSFFSSLQPGDSVLLKRGETFFGSITINKSGTASLPIVISAYGTGNKPTITSLVTMTSWVSKGNGIWESYNSSLPTSVNNVLINDVPQEMGRYPNSDVANKGYLTLESAISNTITDNELNSTPNWTGAELVVRARRWVTDRCLITNHSGTKITYTATSSYVPKNNYGYFIQDDIKTLDKFGEWYYNPSVKKLSIYFGANAPSSYVIQTTTIENLIFSQSFSNVVLNNLNVKGANSNGIYIRSGSNMNVKNCDVAISGSTGILIKFQNQAKIENCTVTNSNNNGIDLGYTGDYATVRNNKVTNTSMFAGLGGGGDGKGFGIQSHGNNTIIEYNDVRNTGYVGVTFGGNSTIVKNNYLDGYCLTKDDGSAIYAFTGSANTNFTGRKVIGNIVMNGVGTPEGIDDHKPLAEGIYMDDNSSGVEISGNTIANIPGKGLFLHNARNMTITNNTIFNNNVQLSLLHDTKGDAIRNCTITNNNFFSKLSSQSVSILSSIADDNSQIGRFDSNYYARPIDDRIVITNSYVNSSGRVNENVDLEGWKARYNKDAASKRTAKQISTFKLNSLIGLNKFPNGTFSSSKTGIFTSYSTSSLSSAGQLEGSYLQVVPSAKDYSVFVDIGALKAGAKYMVRYTIKGSASSMYMTAALRQKVSPYGVLTPVQYRKVELSQSTNDMVFTAPSDQASGQIVFRFTKQNTIYLDNIQLYEADAIITNIDDSIRFEYNPSQVTKTVSLPGNYVDAKNNKFSNSIVLQPYESAVLIKNGGITNTAPSVSITNPVTNTSFAAPASVTISAATADTDGTISKVDFYEGNTLLGSDNTSPYTFTWNNISAGNHSITAKATDNGSLVTASAAVAISVFAPNVAPSVSLTSPVNSATFAASASVTIGASAIDTDGTISKVDFYNGSTLLGTDNTSPYTFTWNNVSAGNYSITAKATDNSSLVSASAAVAISVYTANVAPSVRISSPATNATFAAPASVIITAEAADTDGTISKVDFYNGDTLLGTATTSPYIFIWNNLRAGTYSIIAKATDNSSLITTSDAVVISVYTVNIAPSISITSTVNNATFAAPASVTINASAADRDGTISKVDFYNGDTLLGTVTASPYTFTWNNAPAGTYSITAKATDDSLAVTASDTVAVSVYSQNIAPSVSITSPVATKKYIGTTTIAISADATDADGTISKVDFYNGTTLLKTVLESPYTFSWSKVGAGTYTITAKATDNNDLVTTSDAVTITVLQNQAPAVVITSPVTNTSYAAPATINMSASASDTDGTIKKVDFYNGTTLLHTEYSAPYTYSWSNVPAGNYTIIAKATDNKGSVTTSASVAVSVAAQKSALNDSTADAVNSIHTLTLKAPAVSKEDHQMFSMNLFPNPAISKIKINIEGLPASSKKTTLLIQNLSGITFKSIPVIVSGKVIEADINSLIPGMYIVSIVSDNFIISRRFIKN